MTARWLVPTLVYIGLIGALGVTSKLALRNLSWQELILWTTFGYIVVSGYMLVAGQTEARFTSGTGWAVLSAGLAIGGLVALYVALGEGDASKVIPITAAYPAVTLVLSWLALSEHISAARIAGTALVVAGVVIVTAAR